MIENPSVVTDVAGFLIYGLENVAGHTITLTGPDTISITLMLSLCGVLHRKVDILERLPSYSQDLS